jgi:hypothetical protein
MRALEAVEGYEGVQINLPVAASVIKHAPPRPTMLHLAGELL